MHRFAESLILFHALQSLNTYQLGLKHDPESTELKQVSALVFKIDEV